MFVVSPATILNPTKSKRRTDADRLIGSRPLIVPRTSSLSWVILRLAFEWSLLRHIFILSPIPVSFLLFPSLIQQAMALPPLFMLIVMHAEGNLPTIRSRVSPDTTIDRGMDVLAQRGRKLLTRLAAMRGLAGGRLTLVIEQSEMVNLPPLTFVSVRSTGSAGMLDLTHSEIAILREGLFDAAFDERQLHRINQTQRCSIRKVTLDASSISAHARLTGIAVGNSINGRG